MSATTRLTLSVAIKPTVPLVLKQWNDAEFEVRSIYRTYEFRDGGWTPQRIQAHGKKLKKDGTPGTVEGKSVWDQQFSPEVHRQLRVAAEAALKQASKGAGLS